MSARHPSDHGDRDVGEQQVHGAHIRFVGARHVLVQPLPERKPAVLDLDRLVREVDEVPRDGVDLDRLAHVQHKRLAAASGDTGCTDRMRGSPMTRAPARLI